jgi:Fe-S oxidoreductase
VLPAEVVEEETGRVTREGIEVRLGVGLGRDTSLAELLETHEAVYLCAGESFPCARTLDLGLSEALEGGIDPVTLTTSREGVFAGGSLRRVLETISSKEGGRGVPAYSPVSSLADGRRAAVSIERFLKGESLASHREREGPYATRLYTSLAGVEPKGAIRPAGPGIGYQREEAIAEAGRCLQCECLECVKACTYLAHFKEYPGKCIRKVTKNITSHPGKSYRTHTPFINACSLCGLCGAVCPTDLNMAVVNAEARRIMWEKGFMPPAIHDFAIRDMDSSLAAPHSLVRNQPGYDSSSHLFFPGCQLAASAPDHVERTYRHLTGRLTDGVGLMLGCCGAPAAWSGRNDLFRGVLDTLAGRWDALGRPRVIHACPTCSLIFHEHLPQVPSVSLWEVLDSEGLPDGGPRGHGEALALHDSCTARCDPGIQDSVRNLAVGLGYRLEELSYRREMTKCCGYGGLMYLVDKEVTAEVIASRVEESSSDYLTYCSNCRDLFAAKGKPSYHVLDLVFEGYGAGTAARPGPTFSERRENRRRLAEKMLTELWGEAMPEPPEYAKVKLRIGPDTAAKMESEFILREDVQRVIYEAQRTGNKLEVPAKGRFIAHYRPSLVTYWVEYGVNGDEYEVFNAYSHRMQITKDVAQ